MSDIAIALGLAKVVHVVDETRVVINRGAAEGVKRGDRFLVFGEGPTLIDPDSGKSLGRLEVVRGRAQAEHVQDHIATLRSTERRQGRPRRRVVKTSVGGMLMFPNEVVEEDIDDDQELPLRDAAVGDLARPV